MTYQYRVRDPMGNTHTGSIEAASVEDATQQLRRDGFQVLELDEDDGDDGLFPRRISSSDLIYVTSQLAIMVDTGITLSTALGGIVEQETNPTLRRVLKDLKEAVEGGPGLLRRPGPLPEPLRQDLRLAGQGQRGHRHAGPDARPHRRLPAQGTGDPQQGPRRDGLSHGDDGPGHRRDDLPADLHPAEVHAAVQVEGDATAEADADDDGALRRHAALLVSLARRRRGGRGRAFSTAGAPQTGRQDPRLAEDQRPDRRPHVPQGDHQPQHPHAGHHAGQRRAGDGGHPAGRAPSRRTTTTSSSGRKSSTRSPAANASAKSSRATRSSPGCWCR